MRQCWWCAFFFCLFSASPATATPKSIEPETERSINGNNNKANAISTSQAADYKCRLQCFNVIKTIFQSDDVHGIVCVCANESAAQRQTQLSGSFFIFFAAFFAPPTVRHWFVCMGRSFFVPWLIGWDYQKSKLFTCWSVFGEWNPLFASADSFGSGWALMRCAVCAKRTSHLLLTGQRVENCVSIYLFAPSTHRREKPAQKRRRFICECAFHRDCYTIKSTEMAIKWKANWRMCATASQDRNVKSLQTHIRTLSRKC